jgi:hypothetical protein
MRATLYVFYASIYRTTKLMWPGVSLPVPMMMMKHRVVPSLFRGRCSELGRYIIKLRGWATTNKEEAAAGIGVVVLAPNRSGRCLPRLTTCHAMPPNQPLMLPAGRWGGGGGGASVLPGPAGPTRYATCPTPTRSELVFSRAVCRIWATWQYFRWPATTLQFGNLGWWDSSVVAGRMDGWVGGWVASYTKL